MKTIAAIAAVLLLAGSVSASPDGKALYQKKCGACHGSDGVAKKSGAGSKNFKDPEFKKTATAASIEKVVHHGIGKMKPVKLSAADASAVAAYILSLPAAK